MALQLTILILDSEPIVREALARILSDSGYTVESASTLSDALAIMRLDCPDLLITNVHLADATGLEALHKVRAECPDLPLLMVPGLPDSDLIGTLTKADNVMIFPKPFPAGDLVREVRRILS